MIIYNKREEILVDSYFHWVQHNPLSGMIILMILYVFMAIFMIPGLILTLTGAYTYGMIYGPLQGFFICLIVMVPALSVGGLLAFTIGRFLLYRPLRDCMIKSKYFKAVDNGVRHNGFSMIVFLRMSPIIPGNVFNYFMSVTSGNKII